MPPMLMIRRWIIYNQRARCHKDRESGLIRATRGEGACSRSTPQQSQNRPMRFAWRNAGDCRSGQREQAPLPQKIVSNRIPSPTPPHVGASLLAKKTPRFQSKTRHRITSSLAPTDPNRRPSGNPRILAPLPTTTPESAGLCALFLGSIVVLPLPISGRV
jgi:hypothetical protein